MAKRILAEDLSVRAVEQEIRKLVHGSEEPAEDEDRGGPASSVAGPDASSPSSSSVRKLPAPGVLELEELLADYLNTRVKVDVGSKHGRVIVDFATIEDLERIYKLMVGGQSIEHQHSK
jgi:ParB family chromosome partitioning protein